MVFVESQNTKLICYTDNLHEMPSLIFSEKQKNIIFECCLLVMTAIFYFFTANHLRRGFFSNGNSHKMSSLIFWKKVR